MKTHRTVLAASLLAACAAASLGAVSNSDRTLASAPGCLVGPEVVPMRPTQSAPGGRGTMTLSQPGSPFEITVDAGGHHMYDIVVQIDRLRRRSGASYVVWVATPELDEFERLGALGDGSRLTGRVAWNQFMVFVSEEASPDVERWLGPIVLTGLSPSGRLHTMAGHGPFEDVSCQQYY